MKRPHSAEVSFVVSTVGKDEQRDVYAFALDHGLSLEAITNDEGLRLGYRVHGSMLTEPELLQELARLFSPGVNIAQVADPAPPAW